MARGRRHDPIISHCEICDSKIKSYCVRGTKRWCSKSCYKKTGKIKKSNSEYNLRTKQEVFKLLGNKCACPRCTETKVEFLCIDHINPKIKDKDNLKLGGNSLWLHILTPGVDLSNYQLLCWNCNSLKSDYMNHICPHMGN